MVIGFHRVPGCYLSKHCILQRGRVQDLRWGDNHARESENDSRTNSHRTLEHHKCFECKNRHKRAILINYFGKNLWYTFTQILNEKI